METKSEPYTIPLAIVVAGIMLSMAIYLQPSMATKVASEKKTVAQTHESNSVADNEVYPKEGVVLPVTWEDMGKKLASAGAIDAPRFQKFYEDKSGYTDEYDRLLNGSTPGKLKITRENAGFLLNMFWALGLSNKNEILEKGEMADPRYGGAGRFASTGGWTMAEGDAMNHYSRHSFMTLTPEQQALVQKVSRGIYRPCCGNSVHFPDCNHGMAMLGLLELMASQGATEKEMWDAALAVNSYWFPDTYMTLAAYMGSQGTNWKDVNPQEILGANFSSSSGFARIAAQVKLPSSSGGGSGCGVDAGTSAPQRQQSGCGI